MDDSFGIPPLPPSVLLTLPFALTLSVLSGCAVDTRELVPAGNGATGSFMKDPGDGAGGDGSTGGSTSMSNALVDGCADLDTDGVADCSVTLVQNPTFTSDVDGWTAGSGASWVWDPMNALDDTPSGSGKLTLETPRGSATECIPVDWNGELVVAWTNAYVEPPEDGTDASQAQIGATFFPGADCHGASVGSFDAPPSSTVGEWTVVQAGSLPVTNFGSILVSLTAVKANTATRATIYFDNVMVRLRAL